MKIFSAPLFELAQDEVVKEKALDAAKQFFTSSNITVNLLPALIAGALLLLLGLPLIALLFQVIFLLNINLAHPFLSLSTIDSLAASSGHISIRLRTSGRRVWGTFGRLRPGVQQIGENYL